MNFKARGEVFKVRIPNLSQVIKDDKARRLESTKFAALYDELSDTESEQFSTNLRYAVL